MKKFKVWIEELLRIGKENKYFSPDAELDFENEIIKGAPGAGTIVGICNMDFKAWMGYYGEGMTPQQAMDEDLSYM